MAAMPLGERTERADGAGELPRSFGRYVLFDHIGRGGMADIFLCQLRTSLGGARNVVLKQVLRRLGDDASFRAMLTAEAKLAAKLNHANVVQVFDFGEEDGRLYIGMDYVEGFDLRTLLGRLSKAKIPLPAEFALLVIRETLKGLDYAHRARDEEGRRLGIVHRDVSPSNVLISFEGEVKLCDFGIARAMHRDDEREEPGSGVKPAPRVVGKSAYMSPEQAKGENLDARADLFAAGILLWETCAGRRLYRGTEAQMLELARAGDVPELPDRGLPNQARLQTILSKATEKDRDARYASAADFLHDLESYAIETKLMASPLRLGTFLTDHFAEEIVSTRRAREASAKSLPDADPKSYGPSSAPPPSGAASDVKMPPPPAVPPELFGMARTVPAPEHEEADAGATTVEPSGPVIEALAVADAIAATERPSPKPAFTPSGGTAIPLGTPDPEVLRRLSSRPPPSPAPESSRTPPRNAGPLQPFTPAWYALVGAGAVLFGLAVYWLLH